MNYADLADMLAPVGLTVAQPGQAVAALPCITLEPLGMSLLPGVASTFDRCNISIRYPIAQGDPATFDKARLSTAVAIAALKGTQVTLEADVDILAEADTQTPMFKFQISAAFPGIGLCAPEPPDTSTVIGPYTLIGSGDTPTGQGEIVLNASACQINPVDLDGIDRSATIEAIAQNDIIHIQNRLGSHFITANGPATAGALYYQIPVISQTYGTTDPAPVVGNQVVAYYLPPTP